MLHFAYKTVSTYCSIQNNLVLLLICSEGAQTHITSIRCFSAHAQTIKISEYLNTILKICAGPFLVEIVGGWNCLRLMFSD